MLALRWLDPECRSTAPAELFIAKRSSSLRAPLGYRRFPSAAQAIRFAVEELPAWRILGAFMQIGDLRFDGEDIRLLYNDEKYPLQRAGRAHSNVENYR